MNDMWPFLVVVVVIGVIIETFLVQRRRRKDYREIIEPELRRLGFEFLSSTPPGFFEVSPFPRIEIKVERVRTRTPIGRGEFSEYRIVRYRRQNESADRQSWVELEFEAFRFRRARWNPEPTAAEAIEGENSEHHGAEERPR